MADGIRQTIMALSTVVDLYIEGKKLFPQNFTKCTDAKVNKTLLGLDFLNAAGPCDVQGGKWHFSGNPPENSTSSSRRH
ncbi:hypothetical protein TNCV_951081 [Trichonephila clavipes]|nr:hypothetical protein TNCV_951081 [Trichonephila clavipes]